MNLTPCCWYHIQHTYTHIKKISITQKSVADAKKDITECLIMMPRYLSFEVKATTLIKSTFKNPTIYFLSLFYNSNGVPEKLGKGPKGISNEMGWRQRRVTLSNGRK